MIYEYAEGFLAQAKRPATSNVPAFRRSPVVPLFRLCLSRNLLSVGNRNIAFDVGLGRVSFWALGSQGVEQARCSGRARGDRL